jgi:hypothetical protein
MMVQGHLSQGVDKDLHVIFASYCVKAEKNFSTIGERVDSNCVGN